MSEIITIVSRFVIFRWLVNPIQCNLMNGLFGGEIGEKRINLQILRTYVQVSLPMRW